ncbi:Uncharacterised protein [Mycobacteroides abscessus subsp. abscessus]|nr:Uncharacterised protein [Mycobacteroides abscessus subsp. abscessus]SKU47300.1 Uncharacterised protein [Mycobacteroides abscessus subsp. abscessus]
MYPADTNAAPRAVTQAAPARAFSGESEDKLMMVLPASATWLSTSYIAA